VHRPRAGDPQAAEAGWKDDEVPGTVPRGRGHDHPYGAQLPRAVGEAICSCPGAGEPTEVDAELVRQPNAPQIEHGEALSRQAPESTALIGRVDCAIRGRRPLRPGGGRLERRIERPRLAGAVVATVRRRRPLRWEGRRVETGLPMGNAAERRDRFQT
jgi:hypothetical protein